MALHTESAPQDERSPQDHRELEWQLATADLGTVRRWLADHHEVAGLIIEPRSTLQLQDTYFDTDDWRIHRAGFALRIRVESGKSEATLKALRSTSTELANRRELSEPMVNPDGGAIPHSSGPVGTRVHDVAGAHALQALFEVRTSRQRFAVSDDSQELGEIALDETVVSRPRGEPRASTQRVEVEALTTLYEPLQKLVRILSIECALEPVEDNKYSVGLKSVGLAPVPALQFTPSVVDPSMHIDEVALANLRRHLSAWLAHEPGARLGDDPEELHNLRIAGRRLDAILGLFRPHLPRALVRIRPTLKKLLQVLGNARDFDVALNELDRFTLALPPCERESAEPLRRHLQSERARARGRMLRALDSASMQRVIERLTLFLTQPSSLPESRPAAMAVRIAPELIRDRYKKVRKGANRLTAESSMEDYHAVRSRAKKLRYAIETVAVIYGKPADEMLRALRRWQDQLGAQQDAHVANSRLLALAAAPPKELPPGTLFVMGRLAERHAVAAKRARKRLAKAFQKVRGWRWKALRLKLDELNTPAPEPVDGVGPVTHDAGL
jgi:CHAD domain-containing protein